MAVWPSAGATRPAIPKRKMALRMVAAEVRDFGARFRLSQAKITFVIAG